MQGMEKLFCINDEPVEYPLLILCGEYDLDLVKKAGIRLEELEPKSEYVEISHAGHCANIDNAADFNKVLEKFIQSNS